MYAKRIQIDNYGPIDHIDIAFPFEGDFPKPVVLVGENGSGKSILLSHIVNGLLAAQGMIYPDTPEVEANKVYKLRDTTYIKSESEFSFSRVDFEDNLFIEEMMSIRLKKETSGAPVGLTGSDAQNAWQKMDPDKYDYFNSPALHNKNQIAEIFSRNCVLYFPPNRFEEPAWLNEENLKAKAEYMNLHHLQGYTDRKIINYSPLSDNQNWLFEVLYDRGAFEPKFVPNLFYKDKNGNFQPVPPNVVFKSYQGAATTIYENVLSIVRSVFRVRGNLRFGIGKRQNRIISLMQGDKTLVPNIFQLSTGETSLLNLFLSILRDFDLSSSPLTKTDVIRGIVIVDEIDLHLHAIHQHEILPQLVRMFPQVQFIVTTHSPLFVLGMGKTFGEDGFALYRLPHGQQISPEEFSEFEIACKSFTETRKFLGDVQQAVKESQRPVIFLDGTTDVQYLQKAAECLRKQEILETIELRDGGGHGRLDGIFNKFDPKLSEIIPQKVILLHDCDKTRHKTKGKVFERNIPKQENHPLQTGIENLFEKATLERAQKYREAFFNIDSEHEKTVRGKREIVPERWGINKDEKTNLCDWLCENGTAEDFKHFQVLFDQLEEILIKDKEATTAVAADQSH